VLESGCKLFASKGFRDTTVQQVCRAARANVAAVNYYFGTKENLYHEAWRHAEHLMEKAHDSGESDDVSREAWVRGHIRARVESIFDEGPGGWFPRIIRREMADPTPMAPTLRSEFLVPRRKKMEAVVRAMLGPGATEQEVRCCGINMLSLYVFLNVGERARRHLFKREKASAKELEAVIEQMQAFVLSGVRGVRARIEKRAKP